jgi:hypothetical protein
MKVKGTAISFLPSFIEGRFGTDKMNAWVAQLPPASRDIFSKPIMATSWYPLQEAMAVPLRSVCASFFGGDIKGAWETGRYSADFGLKGIYKIFVKLGSPEGLARKAAEVLPKYYDPCAMEILSAEKGSAVLRVTNFPESDAFTEARLGGYMQRGVEISGGTNVRVDIAAAMSKGEPYTEYRVTWKI